jgi:ATP-grasp domain
MALETDREQRHRETANASGLQPTPGFERPMILTTMRWFSSARLAHALTEAGFAVSACRPAGHALGLVDGLTSDRRLTIARRARSVVRAIQHANPDIILADDERALALMRRLHIRLHTKGKTADPRLAALIARSLGNVGHWPEITSRTAMASAARSLGIAVPETKVIGDADALRRWTAEHQWPIVLKTDGSWGGLGVAIAREESQLPRAWRTISGPPGLLRSLRRLVVDREASSLLAWIRRVRPVVNAQEFVDGREAVVTAACDDGTVEALVCLEVVQESEARGPASVVRIIDHPAMAEAARKLIGRFRLSGFCGFDFILTDCDEALLTEMNARVTPTCYLLVEGDHQSGRTIALFPPESLDGTRRDALDVPVHAPALIRRGEKMAARQRRPLARLERRLAQRFAASH